MSSQVFQQQLVLLMPKMRQWALALTRNSPAADDLVQEVAAKAMIASESFEEGTNFSGWIHRILINQFLSSVRSRRKYADMDWMPDLPIAAPHEHRTALRELSWAMDRLPADQKQALLLIALEEKSYENASEVLGCAIGTLKSRVHRARLQLRRYMGENSKKAA